MSLVHISGLVSGIGALSTTSLTILIEDPNSSNNRLFLSGQAHDGTFLSPVFNQSFHYNGPNPTYAFSSMQVGGGAYNNGSNGIISLQKASINCYYNGNVGNGGHDSYTAFHKSLDPLNYPARRNWYTLNNRIVMSTIYTEYQDVAGQGTVNWFVYPSDITQGYLNVTANQTYAPNNIFFEDSINNKLWGISSPSGYQESITYVQNYDNAIAGNISFNNVENTVNRTKYFLGPDIANNTYWVEVAQGGGDPYYIYKYTPNGLSISYTIVNGITTTQRHGNWYNSRPSNVRYDSAASRVFYSSHFDSQGEFRPVRFQWDPTNTQGIVTATTCTMVYGVGTSSNYIRPCVVTNQSGNTADNWSYQGWQFRPSGSTNTYITFIPQDRTTPSALDNSSSLKYSGTRWNTPITRVMMTYAINTLTDSYNTGSSILTYHSSYQFASIYDLPRDWLPITGDGTQLAMPASGKVNFFTFNPTLGWGITNNYPNEMMMMGLDSQNRLWGVGQELGQNTVHLITPTVPYTVSVIMPNQNFTFTGTNILTTATLYAYDTNGNQTSVIANLTINGTSMLFTDNNTVTWNAGTNLNSLAGQANTVWRDATYDAASNYFVATGQAASGLYSYSVYSVNGQIWSLGGSMGVIAGNWYSIASNGNGTYISVNFGGNQVAVSTNRGLSWINYLLPSTQNWSGIAYGNGVWVVVSGYSGLSTSGAYSADGINWTAASLPTGQWTSVTYGNGIFVALDSTGLLATSTNGQTWSSVSYNSTLPSNYTGTWKNIRYGGGYFLALAEQATANQTAAISTSGSTWSLVSMPGVGNWINSSYLSALNKWVSVNGDTGGTSNQFSSVNVIGTSTTSTSLTVTAATSWISISNNGNIWVAIAQSGATTYNTPGTLTQSYTTNAITGTNINLTITGGGVNNILVGAYQ
jgi:hypothetical protein